MPNRLANETSPYLLQHADNPVDWYPWGEEALAKAKTEDKPIFLSIGYSACHWCHVMAHESFEDEQVAVILNEHFVSIKVDREERPDLDRIYMSAVQAMTGSGGWPMSVFLTPEGQPFYGGTYFPPTPRYGMPSFSQVLAAVADGWQNRRQELVVSGQRLVAALEQSAIGEDVKREDLMPETVESAFQSLLKRFDRVHGGWGDAPKFPQPMALEFLLRYHHVTGAPQALQMVSQTLEAMARGGMYDQLGGGFHRYSVDDHWLVPHFEKMLYDNAQLARVYLHAWQVTGEPLYRTITEEILDYVVREMTDGSAGLTTGPVGGFYSTQDADSEGEEGKFFVWTLDEIRDLLGAVRLGSPQAEADTFIAAYGVTERGNASTGSAHGFEGKNILEFVGDLDQRLALAEARRKLFEAREQRVHPGRDEKVLTSWNGLMLAAFAEAARALDRDDYRQVAERNADFLLRELCNAEGRLQHTWKAGVAKINGYLEDYTHLIEGLLELYQTTFDPRWYQAARELAEVMIEHFSAPDGGFFDTSDDHERLITRPRELQDNAVPSGNAMAALVLLRLAGLAVEPRYVELAHRSLGAMQPLLAQYPLGFAQWLIALDYALSHPREVAIVGASEATDTRALLDVCTTGYRPHQIVALGASDAEGSVGDLRPTEEVPLLQGRHQIESHATAYVCVDFACRAPVTDPEALQALLK
ncbi:MAG: thioredoxin domain-containing protein [Anaerolineae bacterium]|nr:thioredoxin domain-containing protein [Anaerolineae bacterium]